MADNVFAIGNTNADIVNIGGNANEINLGGAATDLNLGLTGSRTDILGTLRISGSELKTVDDSLIFTWAGTPAAPASISIPGNLDTNGNLGVDGNSVIAGTLTVGNLVVSGSSTVVSIANLLVKDKLIVVAKDSATAAETTGAGIQVDVSLASITYNHVSASWVMNKNLYLETNTITSGNISVTGNIVASNIITGNTLVGTLTTTAQPNITSVGTLTSLTVTGNIASNTRLVSSNLTSTGALTITSAANGNIIISPNGTGTINFGGATLVNPNLRNYSEFVFDFGDISGNFAPNYNSGVVKRFRAIGNISFQPAINFPVGGSMTVIITQDSVGSRLLTPDASYKWASGSNILSTAPNSIDIINIFYDGVNYYCALSKGYV